MTSPKSISAPWDPRGSDLHNEDARSRSPRRLLSLSSQALGAYEDGFRLLAAGNPTAGQPLIDEGDRLSSSASEEFQSAGFDCVMKSMYLE
jgi:hypothetical protein